MTETRDKNLALLAQMRERIDELERALKQRDTTARQCEAVIKKLRERVGNGFRGEVRAFSDSIKGLLQ